MRRSIHCLPVIFTGLVAIAWVGPAGLPQQRTNPAVAFQPAQLAAYDDSVLEDTTRKLTVQAVASPPYQSKFRRLGDDSALVYHVESAYWIRFKIHNPKPKQSILLVSSAFYADARLYLPDDKANFEEVKAGSKYPLGSRAFRDARPIFLIADATPAKVYYFRVESTLPIGLGFKLYHVEEVHNQSTQAFRSYGFFLGVAFIMGFYNLFLYVKLRDASYLFYCLYVVGLVLFIVACWGQVSQYYPGSALIWHKDFFTVPFALITVSLLLYARNLLGTKLHLPTIDKLLKAGVALRVGIYLIGTAWGLDFLYSPYWDMLLLSVAFAAGIMRFLGGFKPAKFFVLGFAVIYSGLLYHTLQTSLKGLLSLDFMGLYNTGLLEMVLFSLALADKFRAISQEKELAQHNVVIQLENNQRIQATLNAQLEQKVAERTAALHQANQRLHEQAWEIERVNFLLQQHNQALAYEVQDIARARVMQKTLTFEEFKKIYSDDEACYRFLEELKWKEGFWCKKCGNPTFTVVKDRPYAHRCTRCTYIESVTAHTIFNKLKFPLVKAFYTVFLVSSNWEITLEELSEKLELRIMTCSLFRKKILTEMESRKSTRRIDKNWQSLILTRSAKINLA